MSNARTAARRAIRAFGLMLVLGLIAAGIATAVAPRFGYQPVVLHGNSMAPTAPIGSLVIDEAVSPSQIVAGDVVTYRTPNGTVITHRVIELRHLDDATFLMTKGDNNASVDPQPIPVSWVMGRALAWVPFAGYVVTAPSMPSVWIAVVGLFLTASLASSLVRGRRRTEATVPLVSSSAGGVTELGC